jgi:mono/diheme cytochrome c family protein
MKNPKWFKNPHAEGLQHSDKIHERSSRKGTVMKFTAHRSSPLFAVISVVVLSFTFVSAQAQTAPNDGATLYKTKCTMCHGPDGAGKTPVGQKLNVRDLRSPEVQKQSDSDLAHVIEQGKGKMPVFGKTLKDDQIKSLVALIRELGKQ